MAHRKQLIEEISANFHAIRNTMQSKIMGPALRGGITHSQLFALMVIEQNHNIGIKEASRMLGISSSAATQLVDALVDEGYVTRRADTNDRRALHLTLSPKGSKHIAALKKAHAKLMTSVFGALTTSELQTFLTLHKKIVATVLAKK